MDIKLKKKGRYTHIHINGKSIKCASKKAGNQLMTALKPVIKKPLEPPVFIKYSKEIQLLAYQMVRGFHDWWMEEDFGGKYYLEPGVRTHYEWLDGNGKVVSELEPGKWNREAQTISYPGTFKLRKDVTIKYNDLRKDWHDDLQRALDKWAKFGFNFIEVNHWVPDYGRSIQLPDIIIDDEKAGSSLLTNFSTAVDGKGQRYIDDEKKIPVVHTTLRKINVSKRWNVLGLQYAFLHELGHSLGLGHPGPYPSHVPGTWNQKKWPPKPPLKGDCTNNTIMSYYKSKTNPVKLGDADKLAVELIYGKID